MGPFELMDLVGVDTGPRDLQELLRAELRRAALAPLADHRALRRRRAARAQDRARLLRLRSGADGSRHRPADPDPPAAHRGRDRARRRRSPRTGAARAGAGGDTGPAIDVHGLGGIDRGRALLCARAPQPRRAHRRRPATRPFAGLGLHTACVQPTPGGVLGRIVCQLINESAFALGEGVGSAADIDTGMVLGLNHPRGPLAWADELGLDHVLAVLDALCDEYREERYRAGPRAAPPGARRDASAAPRARASSTTIDDAHPTAGLLRDRPVAHAHSRTRPRIRVRVGSPTARLTFAPAPRSIP